MRQPGFPRYPLNFFLILAISALILSACQPVGLKVEQVAAEADLIEVRAPNCDYGGRLKSVEAVDPHTVRFSLCSADPAFLQKIASPAFAIQDRDYLEAHRGNSESMSQRPNGTGPYRLREYIPGEKLTLEANPEYWGVPPKENSLLFRWSADSAVRLAEIRSNQVDISDRPDASGYSLIRTDPSLVLINRPALNVAYLGMNNEYPPFNDERVRRAVGLMLQRDQIVHEYYPQGSTVAEQFLSPDFELGYTPGYRWLEYNPSGAMDLLNQAHFDFNQVIPLTYSKESSECLPDPENIAREIQSQLAEAGMHTALQPMESGDFHTAVADGGLSLFLACWEAKFPDPIDFYETVFAPEGKAFGRAYTDIVFMSKEAGASTDPELRQSRYSRINELIKLHVPAIPLAHANVALVTNRYVQGLFVGPGGENLEDVSVPEGSLRIIQAAEPASLWPADEQDRDTLRITRLLYDTLVEYDLSGNGIRPSLAAYWEANPERTVYTFYLRYGVKFTNGSSLDANDVVASIAAQWDAASPNHTGRTGEFAIFQNAFGGFINR